MDKGHVYEWHRHDPAQHISSPGRSLDDALWASLVPNEQERNLRRARGWSITPGPATALHSLREPVSEALDDARTTGTIQAHSPIAATTATEDFAFHAVSNSSGAIQRQHRVPQPHAQGA